MHDYLIGMSSDDAFLQLHSKNIPYRVSELDGKQCVLTRDIIIGRVNLKIANRKVVDYWMG